MTAKYIPSLNGLRALSIMFVLISHIQSRNFNHLDSPGGQIGVNIFFIISGFLITFLLFEEEKQKGSISLKKFYFRRILRIFPVYYFLLLTYFILQLSGVMHFHVNSWITSLTYTKYFPVTNSSEWETGHLWSLSIEEHFYLLWPFIFYFLKPYRIAIALIVVLVTPVFRGLYMMHNTDLIGEMTIFQRADALMIGCLFALYYKEISNFILNIVSNHKFLIFLPFLGILLCMGLKRVISTDNLFVQASIKAMAGSTGTLTSIFVGIVILASINFQNNIWYDFLNNKIMNYIGKLSYSLYIWQQIFFSHHIGFLSKLPINIICIVTAAITSYNLIEKPFLKLKSKFESH